jgi:hypothetical protein
MALTAPCLEGVCSSFGAESRSVVGFMTRLPLPPKVHSSSWIRGKVLKNHSTIISLQPKRVTLSLLLRYFCTLTTSVVPIVILLLLFVFSYHAFLFFSWYFCWTNGDPTTQDSSIIIIIIVVVVFEYSIPSRRFISYLCFQGQNKLQFHCGHFRYSCVYKTNKRIFCFQCEQHTNVTRSFI